MTGRQTLRDDHEDLHYRISIIVSAHLQMQRVQIVVDGEQFFHPSRFIVLVPASARCEHAMKLVAISPSLHLDPTMDMMDWNLSNCCTDWHAR